MFIVRCVVVRVILSAFFIVVLAVNNGNGEYSTAVSAEVNYCGGADNTMRCHYNIKNRKLLLKSAVTTPEDVAQDEKDNLGKDDQSQRASDGHNSLVDKSKGESDMSPSSPKEPVPNSHPSLPGKDAVSTPSPSPGGSHLAGGQITNRSPGVSSLSENHESAKNQASAAQTTDDNKESAGETGHQSGSDTNMGAENEESGDKDESATNKLTAKKDDSSTQQDVQEINKQPTSTAVPESTETTFSTSSPLNKNTEKGDTADGKIFMLGQRLPVFLVLLFVLTTQ